MRPLLRKEPAVTKLDLAKLAVNFVVGAGVTKIVTGIIVSNTDPEKVTDKVAIIVGGAMLGSMVAHHTKEYTSKSIDDAAAWWTENITPRFAK
jgi:hypothetical protein